MLSYVLFLCIASIYFTNSLHFSNNLVNKISNRYNQFKYSKLYLGSEFERDEPIKKKELIVENEVKINQITTNTEEISSSMKEKLRKELRDQGADPNYSAGPLKGNPIFIISVIIAVLVIAGGKDVFY